jgi:hypothetical protein
MYLIKTGLNSIRELQTIKGVICQLERIGIYIPFKETHQWIHKANNVPINRPI